MSADQFSVSEEIAEQVRVEGKCILYIAIPVSVEATKECGEEALQKAAAIAASEAVDEAMGAQAASAYEHRMRN